VPAVSRVVICVLPFVNMSGDAEQEYFSDRITEDVITDLSKVSALSVVARNTVFTFKGKNVEIPLIARQLKVSHVLEGSVRKAGQRVRISAQLIDGTTGSHVWAERYDRDPNDIFALQDEISEAIVNALKLKLLPEEKKAIEQRGTTNLEAYNVYLMARQYSVTGNYGNARRCEAIIRLCRSATEIDPDHAAAWALMAVSQAALRFHFSEPGDGGLAAAERALSIDPNLAEAHAAIARLNYAQGRYEDATRYYEKAASLMESDFSSVAMLLDPDNLTMRYNFACGFVELKDAETALNLPGAVLEKETLETVNWAKVDPDLDALRDHPRFKAMLEDADKRLAAGG